MITKTYALKDLDTSRLPPSVQEAMSRRWEGDSPSADKPLTHIRGAHGHADPWLNEEKGTYHQSWILSSQPTVGEGYWFCLVTSPWISPPIGEFLEMIRIDKDL